MSACVYVCVCRFAVSCRLFEVAVFFLFLSLKENGRDYGRCEIVEKIVKDSKRESEIIIIIGNKMKKLSR